jgi:hypothetical protein
MLPIIRLLFMDLKKQETDIAHMLFDLREMTADEKRVMFMQVSVRSLNNWMEYYRTREEYEICQIIKDVYDYKNGISEESSSDK